jgi:predicted dehydrogenase
VNVGLLGAGGIARLHALAYARAGCRIVAVADVDAARGRALADQFGAEHVPEWGGVLGRGDVEAVSVCLPHNLHAAAVLAAAAAGKHVLCEKPIATSLADADRMIAACRAAGVTLMIGHTHRFRPEHLRAKELLDGGAIGPLLQVRDVILAGRDELTPLGWRGSLAASGGGVFIDNGVHTADRLRWWVGAEVAWVAARTGRAHSLVEGEDYGLAMIAFRGGLAASVEQSLIAPLAAAECYALFLGRDGALRVDTWGGLRIARRGQAWEDVPLPAGSASGEVGFDAEIAEFVAALRERRRPSVTGEDGRAALEIILAIYQSAAEDRPVALPLVGAGAPGR